jgi:hypothetical protein
MDCTENAVPLLLFDCCLANHPENAIPLFAGCCLATAAVYATVYRDMRETKHMHCFKSCDCVGLFRTDLFMPSYCCPFHFLLLLYMLKNWSVLCVNWYFRMAPRYELAVGLRKGHRTTKIRVGKIKQDKKHTIRPSRLKGVSWKKECGFLK